MKYVKPTFPQLIIAVLVGLVVFVLVAQVRQDSSDSLDQMRQDDLVRLLDELDTRNNDLLDERDELASEIEELSSGQDARAAAEEAAQEQERVRRIEAGVVAVEGPGIVLTITDPDGQLRAQSLVTVIEELRNAGAEAITVGGVRVVANTYVTSSDDGIEVSGTAITSPYVIQAIGSSSVMRVALEMPGGVLSVIRSQGPTTTLVEQSTLQIDAVATLPEFEYAVTD